MTPSELGPRPPPAKSGLADLTVTLFEHLAKNFYDTNLAADGRIRVGFLSVCSGVQDHVIAIAHGAVAIALRRDRPLKLAFHDADTDTPTSSRRIVARMSACRSACHRNNFRKSRVSDVSARILARISCRCRCRRRGIPA